jgi:hypothetical protein
MHIAVLGIPKSGTTALYFTIKHSVELPDVGHQEYQYFFEPSEFNPAILSRIQNILLKDVLYARRVKDYSVYAAFEKRICIIRDRRDILISFFLYNFYHVHFMPEKKDRQYMLQ